LLFIQLYAGECTSRSSVDQGLSVVLTQLNLTKLKLEYLKFVFILKKNDLNADETFFASLECDFFRVQLKFAFRIRP